MKDGDEERGCGVCVCVCVCVCGGGCWGGGGYFQQTEIRKESGSVMNA